MVFGNLIFFKFEGRNENQNMQFESVEYSHL